MLAGWLCWGVNLGLGMSVWQTGVGLHGKGRENQNYGYKVVNKTELFWALI